MWESPRQIRLRPEMSCWHGASSRQERFGWSSPWNVDEKGDQRQSKTQHYNCFRFLSMFVCKRHNYYSQYTTYVLYVCTNNIIYIPVCCITSFNPVVKQLIIYIYIHIYLKRPECLLSFGAQQQKQSNHSTAFVSFPARRRTTVGTGSYKTHEFVVSWGRMYICTGLYVIHHFLFQQCWCQWLRTPFISPVVPVLPVPLVCTCTPVRLHTMYYYAYENIVLYVETRG